MSAAKTVRRPFRDRFSRPSSQLSVGRRWLAGRRRLTGRRRLAGRMIWRARQRVPLGRLWTRIRSVFFLSLAEDLEFLPNHVSVTTAFPSGNFIPRGSYSLGGGRAHRSFFHPFSQHPHGFFAFESLMRCCIITATLMSLIVYDLQLNVGFIQIFLFLIFVAHL